MTRKSPYQIGIVLVAMIAFAVGISLSVILFYEPTETTETSESESQGSALPQFSMPVLETSGQPPAIFTNWQLELPALFNVWASWCVSCRYEHPVLMDLAGRGVRIYGINYLDETAEAQKWLQQNGDPYLMSIKDKNGILGARIGLYGVPETYFVNADGKISKRHIGILTEQVWQEKFRHLWE